MSTNAIGAAGGTGARPVQNPQNQSPKALEPQKKEYEEQTTVTTHCNEEHWHDRSCPHSVSTVRVPKASLENAGMPKADAPQSDTPKEVMRKDGRYGGALDMLT